MDAPDDQMLRWLGRVCRERREQHDPPVLQVRIAAALGVAQETVGKFERGQRWPRSPELVIGAYADELGAEPIEIWEEAVQRWREDLRS